MNDKDIVALFFKRDESAITVTAETYGSYCHTIAYNILYNEEDAKECVNDTYLGAWKSIPPHSPARLSTFLGKITRNLAINRYQHYTAEKRKAGQTALALSELDECIPHKDHVEQSIEMAELGRSISDFLSAQPQQARNIFIRRYWYLSSIREIAKAYQISESKVLSILFRTRNKLKAHLEKEGIQL